MINTPRPHWEMAASDRATALVMFGAVTVAALIYILREARADRSIWPVCLFLGAGLAVVYEPINNVLGLCAYPEIHQLTWFTALGRRIPVFIGLCYFIYWSAPVLWLVRRIERGIDMRRWWLYYGAFTILVTCFELEPIHLGWWRYYGHQQPLRVLGFPMWWWIDNSQAIFGLATCVHLLRSRVLTTNRRALALIPLLPMLLLAVHGGPAIPVFLALGSSASRTPSTIASVITMAVGLLNIWVYGRIVTAPPATTPAAGAGAEPAVARA